MKLSLRWSLFDHARDNVPQNHSGTWEEFAALLSRSHRSTDGTKRGMPAFSGATYLENAKRGRDAVEAIHAVAFDFDNSVEVPIDGEFHDEKKTRPKTKKVPASVIATIPEIQEKLKGYEYRAYTTWSHKAEWPKLRVVMPLAAPLTPDLWESATEWILRELDFGAWRQALDIPVLRDVARMNFLPSEGAMFYSGEGEALDVDLDALVRIEVPPLPRTSHARVVSSEDSGWEEYGIELGTLDLPKLLADMGVSIGRKRTVPDGVKYRTTCPWGSEHSHGAEGDDAVIFMPPSPKWPSFSCAHSGHRHLTVLDVLATAKAAGLDLTAYATPLPRDFEHLSPSASSGDISRALESIAGRSALERERLLVTIKTRTKLTLATLRKELDKHIALLQGESQDPARVVVDAMLDQFYAGGKHIVQLGRGTYWAFNGMFWRQAANKNHLRRLLLQAIETNEIETKLPESVLLDSAYKLFEAVTAREDDPLRLTEVPPRVVNCRNGELWIDGNGTVDLRPHRADSYLTYVLAVDYDPAATCPKFDKALSDTFEGNADLIRHFEEFLGYLIQPRREYKTWWLFQGSGNNGKTKLMQVASRLLSKTSIYPVRIADANKNEFNRAGLAGKLLLLDDDVDTGTVLDDGFLKQISEDKLLSGRNLYEANFAFISTVVPVLLCNNYPSSKDLSEALQARACVIPFKHKFKPATDPNPFPEILANELSGVLNRALAGYKRLQERGGFLEPLACAQAKRDFLRSANPLVLFIDEGCSKEPTFTITSTELYRRYRNWADNEGHRYVATKGNFERDLASLGFRREFEPKLKQYIFHGLSPIDFHVQEGF